MLLHVAARLGKAIVREHPLAAGDVRDKPLEHRPAGLVLGEAEIEQVVQETPALRYAERDGAIDPAR